MVLEGLGIPWMASPHTVETPRRAARAMVEEICAGIVAKPPSLTVFPLEGTPSMIVSRRIPVRSLCAHHLLPFVGYATVAYIPGNSIVGISKLSRVVHHFMAKPQVQENLTTDIADHLQKVLKPQGIGVVIQAKHFCMELRGVKHESNMLTSALRGEFEEPEVRAEFLSLAGVK